MALSGDSVCFFIQKRPPSSLFFYFLFAKNILCPRGIEYELFRHLLPETGNGLESRTVGGYYVIGRQGLYVGYRCL